jgi:PAS domain S-box-containing protein
MGEIDITEQPKRRGILQGRDLLLPLLSLVNSTADPDEFATTLTQFVKTWLSCDSVQLKHFRKKDLIQPAQLCMRGLVGDTGEGKVKEACKETSFVDCIGARLLTGGCFEISGAKLTPNGSFWTNNLSAFLKKTQPRNRNRAQSGCCGGNGSRSIILTPLRHQGSVFGLLEVADRRSGRFTEFSVELVEQIARLLARIFRKTRRKERYRGVFEGAGVGLIEGDFSKVKKYVSQLGGSGIHNLSDYFDRNPIDVIRCADMIVIKDANKAAINMYGAATKNDLISGFRSVFTDEAHEAFKRLLVALHEGQTRFYANTINRSLNGELKQLSLTWNVTPVHDKTWSQIVCSVEDITERKRVTDRLNEQLLFFQTLIDTVPTPIFYKDTEHRYLGCNKAFETYSHTTKEDVVGKTIFDLLGDTRKARIHHLADGELLRHPGKRLYESSIDHSNGKKSTHINRKATFVRPDGTSAGIVGVILDITEQKVAEDRLRKSQEELRNLSRRLQYVREEERKAISREIHDQLGQTLTVLQMELALLVKKVPHSQKNLIEGTKQLTKRLREAIEIVRSISARTRPEMLDDLGLAAAIEWQVSEFQKLTGLECFLNFNQTDREIEADLSTAIFRILQEAITNVWRHAHATHVDVLLQVQEDTLILEVSDNGKGITERQANDSTSTGLIGMRERVYPWAGQVSIKGRSNGGTTVSVTVPLKTAGGKR